MSAIRVRTLGAGATGTALVALVVALVTGPVPAAHGATAAGTEGAGYPVRSHSYGFVRAREVVERRVIGHSVQGRPIVAVRKGNPDARLKVVLLGQMHGDERAGTATARFVRDRLPVDSDADVWIVPTMNPDGAAARTRTNARGVDLNRNWPTDGWRPGPRDRYYPGPRRASEPETRAMIGFLREVRPRFVASIHQPLATVARNRKDPGFVRRLADNLGLGIREVSVGTPPGRTSPTLTGWYSSRFEGAAVTVEYRPSTTERFRTWRAGNGILTAAFADW